MSGKEKQSAKSANGNDAHKGSADSFTVLKAP